MVKLTTTGAFVLFVMLPSTLLASSLELAFDDTTDWKYDEKRFAFTTKSSDSTFLAVYQQEDDSDIFSFTKASISCDCLASPNFKETLVVYVNNRRINLTAYCLKSSEKAYQPSSLTGNEALKRAFLDNLTVEIIIPESKNQSFEDLLFTTKGFAEAHDVVVEAALEPI